MSYVPVTQTLSLTKWAQMQEQYTHMPGESGQLSAQADARCGDMASCHPNMARISAVRHICMSSGGSWPSSCKLMPGSRPQQRTPQAFVYDAWLGTQLWSMASRAKGTKHSHQGGFSQLGDGRCTEAGSWHNQTYQLSPAGIQSKKRGVSAMKVWIVCMFPGQGTSL